MDRYADLRRVRRGQVPHLPQPAAARRRHRQRLRSPRNAARCEGARVAFLRARSRSTKARFSTATISCSASPDSERRIPRASLKLEGTANVENALAAWLAARAVGVDDVSVQIAFGSFAGLPHRMVLVRELDGVRWINDSKGTNVDATLKSLESLRAVQRLADPRRQRQSRRVRADARSRHAKKRARVHHHRQRRRSRSPKRSTDATTIVAAGDMQHAVAYAREHAKAGDVVLLSPACASFDQYRNFEHRGEHFEELVRTAMAVSCAGSCRRSPASESRHPTPDTRHPNQP